MLANYHTHTTFCDGKSTPEELVTAALDAGFSALGFSGHGYTAFDERYCMKDMAGYRAEITRLKEKYRGEIEIYLGVEEDSHAPLAREEYDYIIGSCHYLETHEGLLPMDSSYAHFSRCLSLFDGDAMALARSYYTHFCDYILHRRPDVIGHFDLPPKFDEVEENRFLGSDAYWALAEAATERVLASGCLFEVNTGLLSRAFRSSPCPHERLLHLIFKGGGNVVLTSDAHTAKSLGYGFDDMRALLREVGFRHTYVLYNGAWRRDPIV